MDSVNVLALWYSERYLKCVSAFKDKNLLLLELCYRPAKTGKVWNYLRCLHVFNPVPKRWTDMKEGNWLQLLYYFFVFMDNVAPIIGFSWFSLLQVLGWRFLVLHFYGNVYIWFPELIWSHMDWILCFLLQYDLFRWLFICMERNLKDLIDIVFLLTTWSLFVYQFGVYSSLLFKGAGTF